MPAERSDRRDALPQGSVLRDYTIEEVLGHGGFGIVYKACHNELDHVVAIKEYLPSELAVREGTTVRAKCAECESHFADGLRRFREEAKALIEFQQHPSIVDCREFFRANGTAYLVMEYVDGLPLSEMLRQREAAGEPFTESDLLGVAVPLAEGLAHIHQAGVIHRDIKPANILIRRTDQRPVLIDFGAAKQAVAEHSRSLAPYTEGYAAFEQVSDGQLGPWTDLYGFGAVLWRMVAGGNRPWEPPNPVKVESRANARLREAEDPLPTALELGAGRFDKGLLEVIDGCLQLRDTDRIRESDRMVQMLQAGGGANGQLPSPKPHPEERTDVDQPEEGRPDVRPVRRPKGRLWKVVGLAAAIAVAVALVSVALIQRNQTPETQERWRFSVAGEPETATVALLNGPEEYRPGMLLGPGKYEVEVSAPGFVSRREWVAHSESETLHRVALEPLPMVAPVQIETQSVGTAEATDSTDSQPGSLQNDMSNATEVVEPDPVVAKNKTSTDTDKRLQGSCESGVIADCFRLAESYRKGAVVSRDDARAAEYYRQACEGGHAVACCSLGKLYYDGEGVGQDRSVATRYYERACDGASAEGCRLLGHLYRQGYSVRQDSARAVELYERACDGGDAVGCGFLGNMHYRGDGVPLDFALAAEYYRRACEGGHTTGCFWLGGLYSDGEGVIQDPARAAELYQLACDGGDEFGCYSLGEAYYSGEGVPKDHAYAIEFFQRSCEGGLVFGCGFLDAPDLQRFACDSGDADVCLELGHKYGIGRGVPQEMAHAAELYEQACDAGAASGCYFLGMAYHEGEGVPQNRSLAAKHFVRACDSEVAEACFNLGVMYSRGDGVPLDRARAAELYRQACDGAYAAGCTNLGYLYDNGYGVRQDYAQAAELYQRACDSGNALGCYNLGVSFENGEGVPRDESRATELYHQACDGDHMNGCAALAMNYYRGVGIGRDRSISRELLQKACNNGHEDACERLESLDWQ